MLNLVQLQERLKDVPMQALMQYANGVNPTVPPFLALGELNRRKKMQEGAAADQAREMEGAPTVKEQIEQAAGLLALQGSRQRQAAQQQAGIQAGMPMAAPNTTTSEPAQLAGGGFIDDVVVPRDYAPGGMVDPEYLKRLMLRETMQGDVNTIPKTLQSAIQKAATRRSPGISSIPLARDMFKREDYARGGIVAFNGTFDSFVQETSPRDAREREATPEEKERMTLAELQEYNRTGKIPDRVKAQPVPVPRGPEATAPSAAPSAGPSAAPSERPAAAPAGIAAIPGTPKIVQDAINRALGLDVSSLFDKPRNRTFDEILAEQRGRQKEMGISEEFLDKREKALADIQARREKERAEQPMDRLMEMLSGIAEARGGTLGTQGAAGAKRAMTLEAQQRALRDKQDMEMEDLKFTVAAKRDAVRRGDKTAVEALEEQERKQRFDLAKTQAERIKEQGELASQEKYRTGSIGVQRMQAEATEGLRGEQSKANIENARTRALNEGTDLIDRQIQALTTSGLPLNDKQKAELAQLYQKRDAIRAEINAKYNAMLAGSGGTQGFRVLGVKPGGQ